METDDLDEFRAIGALARDGLKKMSGYSVEWEIFIRTFGWFQHSRKANYTPEQLAAIEDGYRNFKATKRRKPAAVTQP